jgi:uracil-DNA glycosylase
MEWDSGPPAAIKTIFEDAPINEFVNTPTRFRLEWGPIYYRGRLVGSARLLVIGQDPAADESVGRRILVGEAGQRVQGFLAKLGITRSYVMVNAILYSIFGQFDDEMRAFVDRPAVQQWRNRLLDAVATPNTEAVLAFGVAARHVVDTWPGSASFKSQGRVFELTHPTARPASSILKNWNTRLPQIAQKATPDPDGTRDLTNYTGSTFMKSDLAHIPLRDFGFGAPAWLGTGKSATRLDPNKPLPTAAKNNPTILWTAIGDQG